MKPRSILPVLCVSCVLAVSTHAQSLFDTDAYAGFLRANTNLSGETLISRHASVNPYYKSTSPVLTGEYAYLDSMEIKLGLTAPEMDLLRRNGFMVSERLTLPCFPIAFINIYNKDLPVIITTDAILQTLHVSYDDILQYMELITLEPNLAQFLDALAASFPELAGKYGGDPKLDAALADVDLYVTVARSLLANEKKIPQQVSQEVFDDVWNAILAETMTEMPLFSERNRKLDFSQFTVRGHYTAVEAVKPLGPYFKCMMWLGRMDFLLTPPPAGGESPWGREDIRRMNLGAVLLNELVDRSGARNLLEENDRIITFLVGESDNLTPAELAGIIQSLNISGAADLIDDAVYDSFQAALLSSSVAGQRILSDFFIMDPFSENPDPLPVSYRLMGQRFIIDSYIFSSVVYDRIIYNGQKIWRPMPDPLDALFVLGNDNALPLLQEQLDTYHYSSQLAALRYLTDAYDEDFWGVSLYNTWLEAIRTLNPSTERTGLPYFMQTAAWQQEKINTQLASWAQLRHDNLLYAKQSYTGGAGCSFPRSYVEPYPEFYRRIGQFAERGSVFFSQYSSYIQSYFTSMLTIMTRLEDISRKELDHQALSDDDTAYLRSMLYENPNHECGGPPYNGWYRNLFYNMDKFDNYSGETPDFVIADVHTQPTDEYGSVVGNVLHVGTGMVNLGIFLVDEPFDGMGPTAFVGPVLSYYEKVTSGFDRLTDERWREMVINNTVPNRPDWVNIYLADVNGEALGSGRELPGVLPSGVADEESSAPEQFRLLSVYPNPFNPVTTVQYTVPSSGRVTLIVYDILGRKVETLVDGNRSAGEYSVRWDAKGMSSGVYFCRLRAGARNETIKMLLIR